MWKNPGPVDYFEQVNAEYRCQLVRQLMKSVTTPRWRQTKIPKTISN